jgi:hypothetical protein
VAADALLGELVIMVLSVALGDGDSTVEPTR